MGSRPAPRAAIVVLVAFAGVAIPTPGGAAAATRPGDWPQFGRDARHTGFDPVESRIGPSTVAGMRWLWHRGYRSVRLRDSGPVVAEGWVFAGTGNGTVFGFDERPCGATSCPPVWVDKRAGHGIDTTPAFAGGRLYVGSGDVVLRVLDAASGRLLWRARTGRDSAPTVAGERLFTGSRDWLSAYPAAGCAAHFCPPLWRSKPLGAFSSPAVADGVVYVSVIGAATGALLAYDADGCGRAVCDPAWRADTGGGVLSSPAVSSGVVYVGGLDNRLHAFAAGGCGAPVCPPLWVGRVGEGFAPGVLTPAVAYGVVYVGAFDGRLYAFGARGCGSAVCDPLWTWSTGEGRCVCRQPVVAGGVVFVDVGADFTDAFVAALDAGGCGSTSCEPLATFPAPWETGELAVAHGMVFLSGKGLRVLGFA